MKARKSFGEEYDCKYDWDCSVQCGDSGIVFSEKGNYRTAFFEAFPNNPSCFLRGEGKTVEEAEQNCWEKYQKVLTCEHEMERRNRTDGYGYCKHCSYSSVVFEPLTKCCKCGIPTAYTRDYRKKWYCKKHGRTKPLDPNPSEFMRESDKRLPRKLKKLVKKAAKRKFEDSDIFGKIKFSYSTISCKVKCNDYSISLLTKSSIRELIKFK
jgi:hypothetical protein